MPAVFDIAPIYADEQGDGEDLYLPRTRPNKDTRSKLMKSKAAAGGLIVNACPFGCEDHELDAEMYCRHLVGFTAPGNDRVYFPMEWREDPKKPGQKRYRFVNGEKPLPVQAGDQLVRVTTCARVYRDAAQAEREIRISNLPPKPSAGDLADGADLPPATETTPAQTTSTALARA
jgi:hypothetical protein